MGEKATESLRVTPSVMKRLDELKKVDQEPYYSVIERLIESFEGEK